MNYQILDHVDTSYLDSALNPGGILNILPASEISRIPHQHLMIWCNLNGIYCLPTVELIDWLKNEMGGQTAIEICAGYGVIGKALQITSTDSYVQTKQEMILLYESIGQRPIQPPPEVMQFEANEAVDHFKPDVVIGSFVTQKYIEGDSQASIFGVDEVCLLSKVKKYITIGNSDVHGSKRIRQYKHSKLYFPWIFTRCKTPQNNEICVWTN